MIQCRIEKLINGGQGIGRHNDTTVFAWNALPSELVQIAAQKKKKDCIIGAATAILEPSPYRIAPKEEHFLCCSPWQIMEFSEENTWKARIAKEVYTQFTHHAFPDIPITFTDQTFHYRNKMEYSFCGDNGSLSFAFFERGGKQKVPISGCALAADPINHGADAILQYINRIQLASRDLTSLIMRAAGNGTVIGALFVKRKDIPLPKESILTSALHGFHIYFSPPNTPAAVPNALLYSDGERELVETVCGVELTYGFLNFFQIHPAIFAKAILRMREFVCGEEIVDYYGGVGSISIALSDVVKKAIIVESDPHAVEYAKANIAAHGLEHSFVARAASAEDAREEIAEDRVIVFDPPRSGLHPKIIAQILTAKPKRIVYLSCNSATSARDIGLLISSYRLVSAEVYNFFPRTPHFECLIVLDRV